MDRTPYDVYEITKQRTQQLRDKGYTVIEKWECEWEQDKAKDVELATFVSKLKFVERLNPRDAFLVVGLMWLNFTTKWMR